MERFAGGCSCGDIRIVASGRPYRVGLCHCLDCRKHHGALFHASAIFPQEAVTIEGEPRGYAGRFFCPRCGSPVLARTGDEVEVNLGSLDAPDQFTPTYESAAKPGCRRFRWRGAMSAIARAAGAQRPEAGCGGDTQASQGTAPHAASRCNLLLRAIGSREWAVEKPS
jgi:hypothetical protein